MPQRTTLPPTPENGNISLTSPPLVHSLGSDTRRRRRRLRQYCGRIKLRSEVNQSVSRTVGFGRTAARIIYYGVRVNSKFDGGSLNPSAPLQNEALHRGKSPNSSFILSAFRASRTEMNRYHLIATSATRLAKCPFSRRASCWRWSPPPRRPSRAMTRTPSPSTPST